eukprot:641980-Pleurochrysis_carterae.AAC.1
MAVIHEALLDAKEYRALVEPRSRLSVQHCYGAANPIPDAISRAYWDTFRSLTAALRVECTEVPWAQARVRLFLEQVGDRLTGSGGPLADGPP